MGPPEFVQSLKLKPLSIVHESHVWAVVSRTEQLGVSGVTPRLLLHSNLDAPLDYAKKRQAAISVVGTLCRSKEGIDFIFMILNYKCLAIWAARVDTADDASGKCLVAVGEDLKSCSFKKKN